MLYGHPEPIIVWFGRFHANEGYGSAARAHVDALRSAGVPTIAVDLLSSELVGPVPDGLIRRQTGLARRTGRITPVDPSTPMTVVVHDRPDRYPWVRVTGRARAIGYSYCETEQLPEGWAGLMIAMDRVWASSQHNRDAMVASGVPPWLIDTVPVPVDRSSLAVAASPDSWRGRWPEQTVFLTVVSTGVGRRDLESLYESFLAAFHDRSDVALVVKCSADGAAGVREAIARAKSVAPTITSYPPTYVIDTVLTREELLRLQASVDCYVSTERGDGWDLPAVDSMVLGVPVVTNAYGASADYLDADDMYVVPVTNDTVPCDGTIDRKHLQYSGQRWSYAHPSDFAAVLRSVEGDPQDRVRRGQAAARRIVERFGPATVAAHVARRGLTDDAQLLRSNSPAQIDVAHGPLWRHSTNRIWTLPDPVARAGVAASRFGQIGTSYLRYGPSKGRPTGQSSGDDGTATPGPTRRRPVGDLVGRVVRGLVPPAEFADTIRDYRTSLASGVSSLDPLEAEQRRRELWRWYGPIPSPPSDRDRLASLHNTHFGERAFILGNGPSLVRCDLSHLEGEFTFGVNKIHLLFDEISWRPTYYTLLDWKMGEAMRPSMDELSASTKFLPERFRGVLPVDDRTYWYSEREVGEYADDQFEPNADRGVPSRATVLVTAIQLAFHLGFRDLIIIGADFSYVVPQSVEQSGPDVFNSGVRLHLTSTADDDPNHFSPSYFGQGSRWHDPNVTDMHRMMTIMRKGVERYGGTIRNATIGGDLEALERVDYYSLFTH